MRATRDKEREKITKILNASTILTVHICTVTVAFVHLCIILHPLMWFFFFLLAFCKTLHPLMWMLLEFRLNIFNSVLKNASLIKSKGGN